MNWKIDDICNLETAVFYHAKFPDIHFEPGMACFSTGFRLIGVS